MTPFVINGANVSGYSAAVNGDTKALLAHDTEQTASLPPSVEADWLYMPLNSDEWICEVWLRCHACPPTGRVFIVSSSPPGALLC